MLTDKQILIMIIVKSGFLEEDVDSFTFFNLICEIKF